MAGQQSQSAAQLELLAAKMLWGHQLVPAPMPHVLTWEQELLP